MFKSILLTGALLVATVAAAGRYHRNEGQWPCLRILRAGNREDIS